MITYDTPLDRARALKDEFIAFAADADHNLPDTSYVQVGDIVRDCEAVVVSVGGFVPGASFDPVGCVAPRTATFLVEILRGCSIVFNRGGMTDHEALEGVSEQAAKDGNLLYEFAQSVDTWTDKEPWSIAWSLNDAQMSVSSLQITLGIP